MTVSDTQTIDAIGVQDQSRETVLTLIDHLPWEDDPASHLIGLQDKLNTYLHFVESGQLLERYPEAVGRQVAIEVVFRHPPSDAGRTFMEQAARIVAGAGLALRSRVFDH